MSLTVKQSAKYRNGGWDWSVWLEGPAHELDCVESVTYVLHPTFPNPVRVVTERSTGFQLEEVGWGGFTLHAQVKLKEGGSQEHTHELVLTRSSSEGAMNQASQSRAPLRVVISHSAADEAIAEKARGALLNGGMNVVDPIAGLRAGESWDAAVDRAIRESDLLIPILSASSGRWVEREVGTARTAGVPIVPIVVEEPAPPSSTSHGWASRGSAVVISRHDMSQLKGLSAIATQVAVSGPRANGTA